MASNDSIQRSVLLIPDCKPVSRLIRHEALLWSDGSLLRQDVEAGRHRRGEVENVTVGSVLTNEKANN